MTSLTNGNCYSILKNVCVYWKILGLCPLDLVEATIRRPPYYDILYKTIITITYFTIYYRALVNRVSFIMTQETPIIVIADFLALSIEFFLIISAWLLITLRHDRLEKILNMFKKIQERSKMFGIGQDFRRIFKTIRNHAIIINIVWFILYISDHVFLYETRTFKLNIWLPFNLPRVISHNVILMFIDVLWILKKFFFSLNEKIRILSRRVIIVSQVIPNKNQGSLNKKSLPFFDTQNPLANYGQLHSDLTTLTKMIVEFFSVWIILVLLIDLILMASDLYILCLMPRDKDFMTTKKIGTFVELGCWWCLHLAETIAMIAMSDSTTKEANRTGLVLHTMLTMDYTNRYVDAAQILSFRLLRNNLKIDFYGLFQMKLSLVHEIIGMVVTYITIMMQLDIQDQQEEELQIATLDPITSHTD